MGLFPCFPKVNRFCFCTRNLKCASVTIITIGMISSIHRISIICAPLCKTLYNVDSPVLVALHTLMYLLFAFEMMLLASGFALLLSIFFRPHPLTADFYICCVLVTAILSIVFVVIDLIQGFHANCGFQVEVLNFIVYFVMWIYFVFVINAYRDALEERY